MGILIRPIITEKATADSEDKNRFAFEVAVSANKVEIRKAVEELYDVNVDNVRTMVMPGKSKVRYTKQGVTRGGTGKYKKAIVQVRSGETIDLYSEI
jgi:large subunit ribosomal protein L23